MQRIINGLRYDTNNATLIGMATGQTEGSDPYYWSLGLYKTEKGRYFLAGQGNSSSPFGQRFLNSGGEGIVPLTDDGAYGWAEQYLTQEILEQEFADQIQDA